MVYQAVKETLECQEYQVVEDSEAGKVTVDLDLEDSREIKEMQDLQVPLDLVWAQVEKSFVEPREIVEREVYQAFLEQEHQEKEVILDNQAPEVYLDYRARRVTKVMKEERESLHISRDHLAPLGALELVEMGTVAGF